MCMWKGACAPAAEVYELTERIDCKAIGRIQRSSERKRGKEERKMKDGGFLNLPS